MSSSVSRFTLNGMFLMTIAVGIMSSSDPGAAGWAVGIGGGGLRCPIGGEPPAEEKSELLLGERERLSGGVLSSHCCHDVSEAAHRGRSRGSTYLGKTAAHRLGLEGRRVHASDVVRRLRKTLGGGVVELSIGAGGIVVVRIMKTLLRGAVGQRERGNVRRGGGHYVVLELVTGKASLLVWPALRPLFVPPIISFVNVPLVLAL